MNKLDIQVKNISYDPTTHEYTRTSDGKLLAGVSSVSELVGGRDKNHALMQWAANSVIDYINDNFPSFEEVIKNPFALKEFFDTARYAYKDKSSEAKDIGTNIHRILELHILGEKLDEFVDFLTSDIGSKLWKGFRKWEKDNNVEWLASELLVGDAEELECAGRLDALAKVNNKLTLIDFKVANTIGDNYFIQTAGYAELLRRMGIDVEQRIILRLPKTEKRKIWVDGRPKFVENNLEAIEVKNPLEWEVEIFIKAREIYKYLNR